MLLCRDEGVQKNTLKQRVTITIGLSLLSVWDWAIPIFPHAELYSPFLVSERDILHFWNAERIAKLPAGTVKKWPVNN